MSKIFETHAHYDDAKFDDDRDELISSLPENGIEYVVNIGTTVESSRISMELAGKYDFVYAAVGIHPSDIDGVTDEDIRWLKEQAAANPKVVAIGEVGLDYHWDKENKKAQWEFFEKQIEAAKEIKKPLVIHSREAALDTFTIMKACHAEECGGVLHCFSYAYEEARKYLDMGFYLGIGGVVTYTNAPKLKEVVEKVPLDRIVLETDSPYLTPVPLRGKRNSSLNIPLTAKAIADIKGIDYDTVVKTTAANALKMYGLQRQR